MEILNIIELHINSNGEHRITNIESYIITDEQLRDSIVSEAEEEFIKKCKQHGLEEDEDLEYETIEEAFYEDNTGYSVSLVWSYYVNTQ